MLTSTSSPTRGVLATVPEPTAPEASVEEASGQEATVTALTAAVVGAAADSARGSAVVSYLAMPWVSVVGPDKDCVTRIR